MTERPAQRKKRKALTGKEYRDLFRMGQKGESSSSKEPVASSSESRMEPLGARYEDFIKLMQDTLKISSPSGDALSNVPARSISDFLHEYYTKFLPIHEQGKLDGFMPKKCGDPGSFLITIKLGNHPFQALCDLGASASLIPLSIWNELNIGVLKPVRMRLSMADGSCTIPTGAADDVIIQLDKYYIPEDFVVADIIIDKEAPILLGRPFLATVGAIIDVKRGHMTFEIGREKLEFMKKQDNPA